MLRARTVVLFMASLAVSASIVLINENAAQDESTAAVELAERVVYFETAVAGLTFARERYRQIAWLVCGGTIVFIIIVSCMPAARHWLTSAPRERRVLVDLISLFIPVHAGVLLDAYLVSQATLGYIESLGMMTGGLVAIAADGPLVVWSGLLNITLMLIAGWSVSRCAH